MIWKVPLEIGLWSKPFWDPILVGIGEFTQFRTYSGDWDVHWGYGILTHSHMPQKVNPGAKAKTLVQGGCLQTSRALVFLFLEKGGFSLLGGSQPSP